ncbi:hypothetical protein Golomagni_02951 [Golovinomyces magnicellulatus]|nr:hypothetical protein Golomagni_02951 [Golovinomyces magnicellulatus]
MTISSRGSKKANNSSKVLPASVSLSPSRSSALEMDSPLKKQTRKSSAPLKSHEKKSVKDSAGVLQLLIMVGGIYGSFLTWALLQERLTTTPYGSTTREFFKFPVFLNTVQSVFAALVGYVYLRKSDRKSTGLRSIFPRRSIILPLLLVAATSSLASPFGYASLAHIDYITFILAKSCKLLPVMFLNVTLFRKKYPVYKYIVIFAVTSGVAIFTLQAVSPKKASKATNNLERNNAWGLLLLGMNLLFDGLTNTTQDYIFQNFQPFSGPQMMCANNIISTLLTLSYLGLSPYLVRSGFGRYFGSTLSTGGGGEFAAALAFMTRHPSVWFDVLGFAVCGAIGQVFILSTVYTLSNFSSLILVTITLTRKMLTMILSVIWFGHRLATTQWIGVGLVFGGISAEVILARKSKRPKEKVK